MSLVERLAFHDIEGIRVGRFSSRLNTTCIVYRIGDTIIDTGPPNQWRLVRRFLEERDVGRVLVTHHHEDHSGNLLEIGKAWETRLLAPEAALRPLSEGFTVEPYRRLAWGKPHRVQAEPIPASIDLVGGLTLRRLSTPGHSIDMTCYLVQDRGWLFTGDLYIASTTRYLRGDEDVGQQIESLDRVLGEDFDTVLCSHRGVVVAGPSALQRKRSHLVELCQRARELRQRGRSTAQITRELVGREGAMAWLTGAHFSKHNLIESCLEANIV